MLSAIKLPSVRPNNQIQISLMIVPAECLRNPQQRRVNRSILVCARPRPAWRLGPVSGRGRARRERAGGPGEPGRGRAAAAGSEPRAPRESPASVPLVAWSLSPASDPLLMGLLCHPRSQDPSVPTCPTPQKTRPHPFQERKGHLRTHSALPSKRRLRAAGFFAPAALQVSVGSVPRGPAKAKRVERGAGPPVRGLGLSPPQVHHSGQEGSRSTHRTNQECFALAPGTDFGPSRE